MSLVTPSRILATDEAHKAYNYLCKARKVDIDLKKEREQRGTVIFQDTPQAFFVAAVIGHLLQGGKRYQANGKRSELLQRAEQWDRPDREILRNAFTFLAKLEYGVKEPDDVLQVIAELAETGIRHIWKEVDTKGFFDFNGRILQMRNLGKEEAPRVPK